MRVLLVEDSPTDAKLVLAALKMPGRTLTHVRVETADALSGMAPRRPRRAVLGSGSASCGANGARRALLSAL